MRTGTRTGQSNTTPAVTEDAIDRLVACLLHGDEYQHQAAVGFVMGSFAPQVGPPVLRRLADALHHPDFDVRQRARATLAAVRGRPPAPRPAAE